MRQSTDGTDYADSEILDINLKNWWKRKRSSYPNLYPVAMSLLGAQPTSAQPERDFSASGLFLDGKSSTLGPRKVEVRMFLRQNRAFRPNEEKPWGERSEDHSGESALGIPILKRAAVARHAPGWVDDEAQDDGAVSVRD